MLATALPMRALASRTLFFKPTKTSQTGLPCELSEGYPRNPHPARPLGGPHIWPLKVTTNDAHGSALATHAAANHGIGPIITESKMREPTIWDSNSLTLGELCFPTWPNETYRHGQFEACRTIAHTDCATLHFSVPISRFMSCDDGLRLCFV